MGSAVDRIDRAQRRSPLLGVPIAIVYKFFDDQGTYLAAIITYYAFVAVFPLLLLATTWLDATLQENPALAQELLNSALGQFPIIGTQLGVPGGFGGSALAVVLGSLASVYGALGLGQAIQNATNVAWAVPRNKRPNPVLLRLKSLLLLTLGGIAVLAITVISLLASHTEVLGETLSSYQWPIMVATLLVNAVMFTLFFRLAAARRHSLRSAIPGALMVAALWLALQYLGTFYVQQVLASTSDLNATFGLVLGMVGIIFIAAVIGVLGMETNVVLERRLWPRALLTPFMDVKNPTEADRRAYASYVRAQVHKRYEQIDVTWTIETPVVDGMAEDDQPETDQRSGTNR